MMRHLEKGDIHPCLALMELVKEEFPGYEEEEFIKAMECAIGAKEAFTTYQNDEIAGVIAFSYQKQEITFLAVNPKYRQEGIAKKLIQEVVRCFRSGSRLQVVTFREGDSKGTAAIACYHSCGFKKEELLEEYGYPCQKMTLRL